jgi:DNA-binding transcriptional regulator YbjK
MMKNRILITLLISLAISGCQKQQAESSAEADANIKAQFEQSDNQLSAYLDKLDSSTISLEERTRILCEDYPKEYKTNYMPALLQLAPQEYTEKDLLTDLDTALNFYKQKASIRC